MARAAGMGTTTAREGAARESERREGYASAFVGGEQQKREESSLGGAEGIYSYEGARAPESYRLGEEGRIGGERFRGEGVQQREGAGKNLYTTDVTISAFSFLPSKNIYEGLGFGAE